MKRISEKAVRAEASRGKNEPLAQTTLVQKGQNGEIAPSRSAARRQPGTDEAERSR